MELDPLDPRTDSGLPGCWTGVAAAGPPPTPQLDREVNSWSWCQLEGDEARLVWDYVAGWVAWYNARYGELREHQIPPCWWRHGALVEEITTLAWQWDTAFRVLPDHGQFAQAWHHMVLAGFLARLDRWLGSGRGDCRIGRHRDPSDGSPLGADAWGQRRSQVADMDTERRIATTH